MKITPEYVEEILPQTLQKGINPFNSRGSTYYKLFITLNNNSALLEVCQMRDEDIFYKQHSQKVNDQVFVQTVRDLGTRYRIHQENYEIITAYN